MIYENTENIEEISQKLQKDKSIIALDIGDSKIGIAISDLQHIVSNPYDVYKRRNMRQDIGHLGSLALQKNACAIVIGFPLELDGSQGENCEKVRRFAEKIFKKTNLSVILQDERFSTSAATRVLKESSMTRKRRDALDDKVAASYILQAFLDKVSSRM